MFGLRWRKTSVHTCGLMFVLLGPCLGNFMFGYDMGATSYVLAMLRQRDPPASARFFLEEEVYRNVWWHNELSRLHQSLIVSSVWLGALVGSHVVFFHLHSTRVGRRFLIRLAAVLYVLGSTLCVLSGTILRTTQPTWLGLWCLVLGRFVFGGGVGIIMLSTPTYMSEMCPPSIRGGIVSFKEMVLVTGMVVGFGVGYSFSNNPLSWSDIYLVRIVSCGIPMLFLSIVMPRSVRWLILRGRLEEAKRSMSFVYKKEFLEEEFENLVDLLLFSQQQQQQQQQPSRCCHVLSRIVVTRWRAFRVSIGLTVLQQLGGKPSIEGMSTIIFLAANMDKRNSLYMSFFMIFCATMTVLLVDQLGRKTMLTFGSVMQLVALVLLTIAFWDNNNNPSLHPLVLIGMCLYVGGYEFGFGPITWLLVSEVYDAETRNEATALMVEANFLVNFLVQFLILELESRIGGWGPTFLVFAIVLAYSVCFVRTEVPETKGLSLETIAAQITQQPEERILEEIADSMDRFVVATESTGLLI